MKIVFWGNGERGEACLDAVQKAGFDIPLVVLHPSNSSSPSSLFLKTKSLGLKYIAPENPNSEDVIDRLASLKPDLFVMAGYGKIHGPDLIAIPKKMAINLHAGRLPDFRGSSPLNWALIRGETSVTLSIIKVDTGVDTGDILAEKKFGIDGHTTIRDLHIKANKYFPELLLQTLRKIEKNNFRPLRRQDKKKGAYYPLRFPDDGVIFWDMLTHDQIHNRVRALTRPYPLAFTYFQGRRIDLLASELNEKTFYGEPGRIYLKTSRGLLVCAQDRCLWITDAVFSDNGKSLYEAVRRYDTLATVRDTVLRLQYENK